VIALLLLHAVVGGVIVTFGERLSRRALWLAALPFVATLTWLLAMAPALFDGDVVEQSVTWVPQLGLDIDLRLDGFGALFVLLVAGIGTLVVLYSASYFPPVQSGLGRLIGLLTLFAGAMLGLVVADNLFVLYGFWELTSVCSYFLIGNRSQSATARAAALQALLTTGLGALAMLVGFILLSQAAGTARLSALVADPPHADTVVPALVLVLLGAATKSAQYPFHSWLPGAMVAPTPVSAYLHSATMVKAGVYLVARFTPAFAAEAMWRPAVVALGAATMCFGGLRALRQHDMKLLLAHGTISQLGFMFVLFGIGTPEAITAGCVLLLAHAAFKATLFMGVGVVDRTTGTRDIQRVPLIGGRWPAFAAVMCIGAASMAGLPPLLGFVSKEAAYDSVLGSGLALGALVVVVVVGGSVLTFGYSARLAFGSLLAGGRNAAPVADDVRPSGPFLAPPLVLVVLTVALGLAPMLLDAPVTTAVQSLDPAAPDAHLALWHGFNAALGLSVLTILAGCALFLFRDGVGTVLATGRRIRSAGDAYRWTLRAVNTLADKVTGVVQNGSLPVYAGVVLAASTLVPASALVLGFDADWFEREGASRSVLVATVFVVVIQLAAAFRVASIHRRYAAALLLAGVGYAMAGLFVIQGAPDLALTTVAVESLFAVLFVLVLRSLPDRFEQAWTWFGQAFRVAVSIAVGAVVFVFALAAGSDRFPTTTSTEMVEKALPDGHGRNVVNVILVDFRGFDTVGELTVLAAASIGAVALARAVRRPGRPPTDPVTDHAQDDVPTAEEVSS
jgi:multicomponent Na+:H+ antiporter subunit A